MYTEMEREYKADLRCQDPASDDEFDGPAIKVVGVGGAGNNTVNRLYNIGLDEAEIIGINTDKQHLDVIKTDKKILIGKSITGGLGAGGFWEIGRRAAELGRSTLEQVLSGADIVFITGGMGGGTGTGAAPVVAEAAREQGALVVALVCTPFKVERAHYVRPDEGLAGLWLTANTVVILDNQRLLEYVPNLPLEQAFSVMDQLIAETVKSITRALAINALVKLDYRGFVAVMLDGGIAAFLASECGGPDRHEVVVKMALSHPLYNFDYRKATRALAIVTGGPEMTADDADKVVSALARELDLEMPVVWGACIDKSYEGKVRVVAIMAGIKTC
jgi:cell division protein FtsZ